MPLIFYSSLIILILAFGGQLLVRFFRMGAFALPEAEGRRRAFRMLFFASAILIFILLFYYSREQFLFWYKAGPPAQYLIPPYSGIGYFLYYVFMRFWASYFFSLGVSILFFYVAKKINEKYQQRFFYPEEYYFLAISIFLTGHPNWIFYLFSVLVAYLLISGFRTLVLKNRERISFYYLWIPAAILVILISKWSILGPLLQILKF